MNIRYWFGFFCYRFKNVQKAILIVFFFNLFPLSFIIYKNKCPLAKTFYTNIVNIYNDNHCLLTSCSTEGYYENNLLLCAFYSISVVI